jgi:DNA-binding beta-propeller fold protein YncE
VFLESTAAVDPSGKFLYAANNEDNGASPSTIEKTGDLVEIGG